MTKEEARAMLLEATNDMDEETQERFKEALTSVKDKAGTIEEAIEMAKKIVEGGGEEAAVKGEAGAEVKGEEDLGDDAQQMTEEEDQAAYAQKAMAGAGETASGEAPLGNKIIMDKLREVIKGPGGKGSDAYKVLGGGAGYKGADGMGGYKKDLMEAGAKGQAEFNKAVDKLRKDYTANKAATVEQPVDEGFASELNEIFAEYEGAAQESASRDLAPTQSFSDSDVVHAFTEDEFNDMFHSFRDNDGLERAHQVTYEQIIDIFGKSPTKEQIEKFKSVTKTTVLDANIEQMDEFDDVEMTDMFKDAIEDFRGGEDYGKAQKVLSIVKSDPSAFHHWCKSAPKAQSFKTQGEKMKYYVGMMVE